MWELCSRRWPFIDLSGSLRVFGGQQEKSTSDSGHHSFREWNAGIFCQSWLLLVATYRTHVGKARPLIDGIPLGSIDANNIGYDLEVGPLQQLSAGHVEDTHTFFIRLPSGHKITATSSRSSPRFQPCLESSAGFLPPPFRTMGQIYP